jgi:ornithine cyclodeaminase
VRGAWLQSHATVIAIGSDSPDKRELDDEVFARADKIVVDSATQCARLGELHHAIERGIITIDKVYAELGDIVVGQTAGRTGDELIVCDLTGLGAQDAAIAELTLALLPDS